MEEGKEMPDGNATATEADFKAPDGRYRIIQVDANEEILIVGDIWSYDLAIQIAIHLNEENEGSEFTLWDSRGNKIYF